MKITHSALALMVGSSLTFAATKEFSVIEDNCMANAIAHPVEEDKPKYYDTTCINPSSDKLTVVHFSC